MTTKFNFRSVVYEIPEYKIRALFEIVAEISSLSVLIELGKVKSTISQREAVIRYGIHNVDKWKGEGKITPVMIGRKIRYPFLKLEILNKISQLPWEQPQ